MLTRSCPSALWYWRGVRPRSRSPESLGISSCKRSITVRLGAMIRKSLGIPWLTACQTISIAITIVLPAPVAIFSAIRGMPSFHSALARRSLSSTSRHSSEFSWGPASCSQIAVSTASRCAKNGRGSASPEFQKSSNRRVRWPAPGQPAARQAATSRRIWLIVPNGSRASAGLSAPGIASRSELGRRPSRSASVAMLSAPSAQCRVGSACGGLRIGCETAVSGMVAAR